MRKERAIEGLVKYVLEDALTLVFKSSEDGIY